MVVDINFIGCIVFAAVLDGSGLTKLTRGQVGNAKRNGTCQSFEVFKGPVSEGKPKDLMLLLPVRLQNCDVFEEPAKDKNGKGEFSIRLC